MSVFQYRITSEETNSDQISSASKDLTSQTLQEPANFLKTSTHQTIQGLHTVKTGFQGMSSPSSAFCSSYISAHQVAVSYHLLRNLLIGILGVFGKRSDRKKLQSPSFPTLQTKLRVNVKLLKCGRISSDIDSTVLKIQNKIST